MNQFIEKYNDSISGVLSGFDRLVFRGTLRGFCYLDGLGAYLSTMKVLFKDFASHCQQITTQLKAASTAECTRLGLPVQYLNSPNINKEETARKIAHERGITEGPICILRCVEPCHSYDIHRNPDTKKLELKHRYRRCIHLYHYSFHPLFGFMNARIQTWFPFNVQICINGREWLSRQMDEAGLSYSRADNCFPFIEDFSKAQTLMDSQLNLNWPTALQGIADILNPIHEHLFEKFPLHYYWTTHQSEWATDIAFNDPATLRRLYPMFLRHAMCGMSSTDVMRFLQRRVLPDERIPQQFNAEVVTDFKERQEGARIKHSIDHNSVKAYDKFYNGQGAIFRVETTINNEEGFRVFRPKEGDPEGEKAWRVLRRGVADNHRRAKVSQQVNDRYMNNLSSVDDGVTLKEVLDKVAQPTVLGGKRVRALAPFATDLPLLEAINHGEFCLNGLRNRDIQRLMFEGEAADPQEARRRSAWVSRKLRMLRAHGILAKVPKTHRYQLTEKGRTLLAAVLNARHTPIRQFLQEAA